jgi:hypothetical protein
MKMTKIYILDGATQYNHGCEDFAVYESTDGITAVCTQASSCHSCWQVGHDADHVFATVGDVVPVTKLLEWGAEEAEKEEAI